MSTMEKGQTSERRYLLILACSQRKRVDAGLLPAIEHYDGVNFRAIHKAKREGLLEFLIKSSLLKMGWVYFD